MDFCFGKIFNLHELSPALRGEGEDEALASSTTKFLYYGSAGEEED